MNVPLDRVHALLCAKIGFQADAGGRGATEAAVRNRMRACGLSDMEAYALQLSTGPAELALLIDEIVVRETWFFREPSAFELLREHAVGRGSSVRPSFRIASIPCSTGEEAYSLAICMLAAGVPRVPFEVHAADVSTQAMSSARDAIYPSFSFRAPLGEHERYFERVPQGRRVADTVRRHVRFTHGNVLDPLLHPASSLDVIFCRNLLIYLDAGARAAAFANFRRWLRDDGMLFVGHAEASMSSAAGFTGVGDAGCFAFHQRVAGKPTTRAIKKPRVPGEGRFSLDVTETSLTPPSAARGVKGTANKRRATAAQRLSAPAVLPGDALAQARAHADRGELESALRYCQAHESAAGPTAQGYFLMGVVQQASGDLASAKTSFGKALYLDPTLYEVLVHLALLHERAGDAAEAAKLRARAARVGIGGGT